MKDFIVLAIFLLSACAHHHGGGGGDYRNYYVYPKQDLTTPGAPIAQPYNVNCYGETCFQ